MREPDVKRTALLVLAVAALGLFAACSASPAQNGQEEWVGDGQCYKVDRVYTPAVRVGEAGQVRVIRRRVPCDENAESHYDPPFDSPTDAYRYAAQQSFPVLVELHGSPDFDPEQTIHARFQIPSEYFDPRVPPLMAEIADGYMAETAALIFVALQDGQYQSYIEVLDEEVYYTYQIRIQATISEYHVEDAVNYTGASNLHRYDSLNETRYGLDYRMRLDFTQELKPIAFAGISETGNHVFINCRPVRVGPRHLEHDSFSFDQSLCRMQLQFSEYITVGLTFPHFDLEKWPTLAELTLQLVQSWRVD